MKLGRKLVSNTVLLFGGDQLANLLQFVLLFYVARTYGEARTGLYSSSLAWAGVFVLLADMGIAEYTIREVARRTDPTRALIARGLALRFAGLLAAAALGLLLSPFLFAGSSGETKSLLVSLGIYLACVSLGDVFLAELKGRQKMGRVASVGVVARSVILAVGLLAVVSGAPFAAIFYAFPVAGAVYLAMASTLSVREFGWPPFRLVRARDMRPMLLALVPFAAAILFNEAVSRQDMILLERLGGLEQVGLYWAALKIATIFLGVSGFFQHAIYPMLSELHVSEPERMGVICHRVTRYILILAFPVSAGLFAIAPRVIDLLFKGKFAGSVECLEIMCWVVVIGLTHSVFSALLSATGRQYQKSISLAVNLMVGLSLNALLIPLWGALGASYARLAVEIVPLVMYGWLAHRAVPGWNPVPDAIRPAAASLVMIAAVRALGGLPLPVAIGAGAAVYGAALLLMGGFPPEDRHRFLSLIPPRFLPKRFAGSAAGP
jgi:O-antigen/teichoic acid export membrane protein